MANTLSTAEASALDLICPKFKELTIGTKIKYALDQVNSITDTGQSAVKFDNSITPVYGDDESALISVGTWGTALNVDLTDHYVPLQVHLSSSNTAAVSKDVAAARFKVVSAAAQTTTNLNVLELRHTIGHNVAQWATLQCSAAPAAHTITTGEGLVAYFAMDGTGTITPAGSNKVAVMEVINNHTGAGVDNAAIFRNNATGYGCTNVVGIENIIGTATSLLDLLVTAGTVTNGIKFSGSMTTGISMPGGLSYNPIHIGVKSNSADAGLILTGVTDDTGGVMIFADDGNDTLSSVTSPIWARYLITKDQGTGGPTATGAFFQSKSLTGLTFTTGCYSATKSYYQIGGTLALATSAELSVISAAYTLEGAVTVGSGCRMSGIDVNINTAANAITDTALDTAGIHIRKVSSSTYGWPVGLKINDGGAVTGIQIGTCTTGIKISGLLGSSTAGRSIQCLSTINNANLGDGYGANEFDLTLTGTTAGAVAASSSWIELITGTHANMICAQTNGIYAEAASVMTGATVIFGMRMQCLCQSEVDIGAIYPFSCVSNTNPITALFSCNAGISDMGTITDTGADTGMVVPLYKETSTGTVYYVRLYAHS